MSDILNNPQFIAAVIALIVAVAGWLESKSNKGAIAEHSAQLNGALDARIKTAAEAVARAVVAEQQTKAAPPEPKT